MYCTSVGGGRFLFSSPTLGIPHYQQLNSVIAVRIAPLQKRIALGLTILVISLKDGDMIPAGTSFGTACEFELSVRSGSGQ